MSIVVRRYLERTHALELLLDSWQADHKEAMYVRDLEEIIAECLDLATLARRAWNAFVELIFDDSEFGQTPSKFEGMVQRAIQSLAKIFESVSQAISEAERKGYAVENGPNFRNAALDVEKLQQELAKLIPPINLELSKQALEDFKRGDYRLAGDILHDLQNGCAQGHQ